MSITLTTYRTAIASEIGLDNSTSGDQTQIDKWVNEGVVDFVMRTGCYVTSATLSLSAGTADYSNAFTAAMDIKTIYTTSGGINYPIARVDIDTLLQMRQASTTYSSPTQFFAFAGANLLMVYPTPANAASSSTPDQLTAYYVPTPATLSVTSDTPTEIPGEFHPAVEQYALMRAAKYADDSTSQQGAMYAQEYERWVRKGCKAVAMAGSHRLAPMPRRDSRGVPYHDRSRYP